MTDKASGHRQRALYSGITPAGSETSQLRARSSGSISATRVRIIFSSKTARYDCMLIEFLVDAVQDIGFNRYTITNLRALLAVIRWERHHDTLCTARQLDLVRIVRL